LSRSAYLLVSHGSRDPRPQVAMDALAQQVAQELGNTGTPDSAPLVGTAVLELAPEALHQQVLTFADRAINAGCGQIEILPIFLLPGVHVMEDIPAELTLAQQQLSDRLQLILRPHLGTQPQLGQLLLHSAEETAQTGRILVSHGSRRAESLQPVEAIASQLGAVAAYWSVPPKLETQVAALVEQGDQQIVILPYFLFEGGITDAIGREVDRLSQQFPRVSLSLAKPLGATLELAHAVLQLRQSSLPEEMITLN
jgi:sirohydrochlorin cobaltochelatase